MAEKTVNRKALLTAINHCRTKDVPRLLGRLHKDSDSEALQSQIQTSLTAVQARLDACPRLDYPADLPVVMRREEIVKAIRENQVLVLCGETGSGKTTQLPKLCLEAGQGMRGLIGHTQPRRLAARNVAQRIAEELHSELGGAVGYQVRFNEQVSENSYIKVMTDGILLAETRDDRYLNKYDTIIIDEAHERSLNIDFLMGYLAQLLAKRKDLKVIITSATIDPQRFAAFFEKALQAKVPMITAEGRSFPVETRYRYNEEATTPQAIETAIKELWEREPGDVLVFLPGERDIRETANHLERASLKNAEVLPLYARLSSAQQQRIFTTGGRRRVVLATNVAETSITVPGIRHVVDTGIARISRYSHRSKVQRLPIEPISQASANQRQGRCGRTSPGICVRLYEEADFIARPEFTEPEIKRTNLANVLLQMHDLRMGDIEDFPFLDAPDSRFVRDGLKLLEQLGAIGKKGLTRVGKQMAQLPLDPRLGRVLVAAERSQCLHDALILVAGLSIQDPRERPQERQQAADEAHSAYNDERSDFMSWIKLWQGTREQRKALSSNQYQKWCKQNFLSPLRLHEWQDVHSQLLQQCRALRWQVEPRSSVEIPYERLHKALLHGLLDRIGLKEEAEPVKKLAAQKGAKGPRRKPPVTYQGARNTQFSIFPGSALQKKKPQWAMAWEIVETGRVYARTVATIEPEWLEQIGKEQLKHSYSDPHWSQRQGEVMAHEQITLFGILLAANRRARYAPINPTEARRIFIRQALVDGLYREHVGRGQWKQPAFLLANQQLRDEVEQIEAKARRRDVMIDEAALEDFYEQRIPDAVVDAQSFRQWYGKAEAENPQLLMFSRELLIRDGADLVAGEQFPEHIDCGAVRLKLRYAFEPGREKDGITVDVPAQLLNQLDRRRLDWLVPGLIEEKVTAMIRALPKATRRNFVPAPDFARAAIGRLTYGQGDLHDELAKALRAMGGATIEGDDFRAQTLEPHLNFRFQTLGDKNKVLGAGRDLSDVKQAHSEAAAVAFKKATGGAGKHPIEKSGLSDWSFGDLPPILRLERAGVTTQAWPAVEDHGKDVAIRLLDNETSALGIHRQGVRRLAYLKVAKTLKYVAKECSGADRIETRLCAAKQPNVWQQSTIAQHYAQQAQRWPGLLEELCEVLVDEVIIAPAFAKAAVYSSADFGLMVYEHEPDLVSRATALWAQLSDAAKTLQRVRQRMEQLGLRAMQAVPDIQLQTQAMFFPGFLAAWGLDAVEQYPRYLKALEARLEKIDSNPQRDVGWQNQIAPLYKQLFERIEQQPDFINRTGVREYRWLLEEYRISLFAQPQKPRDIVSLKRLNALWSELKKT